MKKMKSICIFCGSRPGNTPVFADAARHVGATLARRGINLVYGGGHVGLMGITADAVLENGGRVYGVIPEVLADKELAHPNLTELFVVKNMHERKMKMAELADGFIALPGGAGTMEEIFEQWTWLQLRIHDKPGAFLDVDGFYQPLNQMIQSMVARDFLSVEHAAMVNFSPSIEDLLEAFNRFKAPTPKWENLAG
ncbi:MAG TPA: TIGR00730 family Rossman fold protein [Devosia sp.]|nr:TIGR00730 family Rossman fold protein [Devosia sp.]